MGDTMREPWVIAHRGASGSAPENTMAAFRRAVELGAGFIETDLHLTRDARFVAIHDTTLDRTTNGHGAVREMTLAQLRELDAGKWFDRQFMDERIPTLEEILEFAKQRDVVFYLELKYDSAWGMHHALVGALRGVEYAARTTVISFDGGQIEAVRRLDPSIMTGLLVEVADGDPVQATIDVGGRQLCPRADLVTPELVERAHAKDLLVATWTVDQPEEMRRVIAAGVDGVMSNFPDRLRHVISSV
jgi:glycerophosphoryl diester phosphodiesterase